MKYCPYCGAALIGGAVSFCAECGKPLPDAAKPPEPVRGKALRPAPGRKPPAGAARHPAANKGPSRLLRPASKPANQKRRHVPNRPAKKYPGPARAPKPDPRDEGYDGYYDDVLPIDDGHIRDRMDSNLIKRAIIIGAGALLIVILSVIVMSVL